MHWASEKGCSTHILEPTFRHQHLKGWADLSSSPAAGEGIGQNPTLRNFKAAALALIFTVSTCIWQQGTLQTFFWTIALIYRCLDLQFCPELCQCAKETGGSWSHSYIWHHLALCLQPPFLTSHLFRQLACTVQWKAGCWGAPQSLPTLWEHTGLATHDNKRLWG